jgi:Tfp pilus assembly protein PilN
MSVRVNLLPQSAKERSRAARARGLMGAGALVLLLALGGLYWLQVSRVNDREATLAAEQATVRQLEDEVVQLAAFEDLEERRERADQLLVTAMGSEVSFAGLLQDVAAVTPSSTWLESFGIHMEEAPTTPLGATRPTVGRITSAGVDASSHAPGLERFMLELDKVHAFDNVFFTNSTVVGDEERVFVGGDGDESTFSLELDLGTEAMTRRYSYGVPEELR